MTGSKPESKTYLIFGLIFILTVGTVIFIVQRRTNDIVTDLTLNRVQTANHSLVNYLSELAERATLRAGVISGDEAVTTAVKNRDHGSLRRYLLNFSLGMDFTGICDIEGIVLARSYNDMVGEDITRYKSVSAVLRTGKTSTAIEEVGSGKPRLSIHASAPIYDNGKLIGVANSIYDLTQNEFVDEFKERTGCEAAIFLYNERINTTITDESGSRITGSKAPDFVVKAVIGQQEEYLGNAAIYGKEYGVCYSPLIIDGEVIGMLFTGVDIHSTVESQRAMNTWIILASLTGIAAAVTLMVISRITERKYARFSERQLNQQILMANISRSFLSDTNTGTLIKNTLHMVGEFMDLSQMLLFLLKEDGVTLTCCDEWIDPDAGLTSRIGSSLSLKEPIFSMVKSLLPGSGIESCLHSDDPVTRKTMAPYRVSFQNYITTPIFAKGELIGVIDFSKGGGFRKWNDSEISLATLFASTLSGVFEREAMGRRTSIVENSPHMIFYADTDGKMAYANPAVSAVTGYSTDELKTGGFRLIFDEQTVRDIREVFVPKTLQSGLNRHDIILMCKDGRRRFLQMTSFIVKDGLVAAIAVDLTEAHALEAELINAKNKADKASRAKSEFLSNMSHEMRTPMNAIIGMSAIAKNTEDCERKKYALKKIEEASTHLLGIINDILDMMKIEANRLELSHIKFDLRNSLQKAVSFVNFRMEEKRHRFSMKIGSDVPFYLTGDDQRLAQVIINLLANAVKFTPEEGGISLDVSLAGKEDEICELRFEVADSGIGILPEQQERIFHMFEQAESGTTRKFGGTGLGLAISKRIVELMGGTISVESEQGKGSRFIFTVKLLYDEDDTNGLSSIVSSVFGVPQRGAFAGKKILLAEDIEINREILVSLLDDSGLAIDTAENGREALDKFTAASGSYDLVLMDMQMPEMDGLEATRQIRAFEEEQKMDRVPIIAMTANVFKDDIESCLAAGMDGHIGKPLEIDKVFEKLRKYL